MTFEDNVVTAGGNVGVWIYRARAHRLAGNVIRGIVAIAESDENVLEGNRFATADGPCGISVDAKSNGNQLLRNDLPSPCRISDRGMATVIDPGP